MHAHRLRADRHAAFLAEGRADPFSRVRFQEGATVVRCAACGTVFLRESWEALGGRHCGQTETLAGLVGPARGALPPAPPPMPPRAPAAPAYAEPARVSVVPPPERRRSLVPWLVVGALALGVVLLAALVLRDGGPEDDEVAVDDTPGVVQPAALVARVGSLDGRLEAGDDTTRDGRLRDTYTFETRGRGPFAFAIDAAFEPSLTVVAPDGRPIAAPVGEVDRSRAQVVVTAGPGRYTVEVAARARGADGPYTLTVAPQRPSRALRSAEVVQDSLGGPDAFRRDDRFETAFTLALEEGARVTLHLQAQGFTPRVQVTGPGGAVRTEDARTADALTYTFTAPGTGTHTLVLSASEPDRGGAYRLRADVEAPPRVRPLTIAEAVRGTLERGGDPHRFRFDGLAGQRLVLAAAAEGFVPRLVLLGPDGARVATGAEALAATLAADGAYLVELSAPDSTGGPYSLTARVVATAETEGERTIRSEIRREPPGRELPTESERPVGGATYSVDGTSRRVEAALLPPNPGVEASGTYRLTITPEGRVTEAEIVRRSGNPVLDADALRALTRWRFEGGSSTETATVTIRFTVRG